MDMGHPTLLVALAQLQQVIDVVLSQRLLHDDGISLLSCVSLLSLGLCPQGSTTHMCSEEVGVRATDLFDPGVAQVVQSSQKHQPHKEARQTQQKENRLDRG